jgi:hypothetical protein
VKYSTTPVKTDDFTVYGKCRPIVKKEGNTLFVEYAL